MRLCLGTVQFGMNYGIQGAAKPSQETVNDILDEAFLNDVTVLDTASAYGDAEDVLGCYFSKRPEIAAKIEVVSKLSGSVLNKHKQSKWSETVVSCARESLERLHISKFRAYLFHDATLVFDKTAIKSLFAAVSEGLADKVGVSVYTPEEAMKALEYDEIGAIQVPYNLFDRRLDRRGFFGAALDRGVEVYARSSLLQGLLMMEPDKLPERVRFAAGYLRRFHSICESFGVSPLRAAVSYAGNHMGIDYIVFGVDNKDQLEEYLSMREEAIPKKMVEALCEAFESVEEELVNPTLWKCAK